MPLPPDNPLANSELTIMHPAQDKAQISLPQVEAMRAAMMAWLRKSSLEERDRLMTLTGKTGIFTDADGMVRIGPWLVQPQGNNVVWTYREMSEAPVLRGYTAIFANDGNVWRLEELRQDRIRRRM